MFPPGGGGGGGGGGLALKENRGSIFSINCTYCLCCKPSPLAHVGSPTKSLEQFIGPASFHCSQSQAQANVTAAEEGLFRSSCCR